MGISEKIMQGSKGYGYGDRNEEGDPNWKFAKACRTSVS